MHVVGVGVDEADRDRFHTLCLEDICRPSNGFLIEWNNDSSVGSQALCCFKPPPPGHQRLRLAPGEVEHAGCTDTTDFEHIAESARGEQSGTRPDLLQDGV